MIKLFLITLLCVAMFADSQEDQMNEMGTGLKKASADMAEHAMGISQGSPLLMQHATAEGAGGDGRGRGGRRRGNGEREGRGRGGRGGRGRGRGRGGRNGSDNSDDEN
ncbi:PREDICTED: THO complex subunit 4A-like [Acromyrmex echinatior]|uniref:THO complex subunit 4A-like n=1 Tax=Acromyrmex echinatior TaxID=103372 RepID=UPI000580E960|nr:PREDICTED: THO complex subunit 4A-like [Acromyrmex echinatior]